MKNGNCGTQDSRLSPQWTHDTRTRGHFDISPGTRNLRHDTRRDDIKTECPGTLHNHKPTAHQQRPRPNTYTPTHYTTCKLQAYMIQATSYNTLPYITLYPIPSYNTTTYNLQPTTRSHTATQPTSYILHPQKHYPSTHHPTNLSPCSLQSSNNLQPTTYNILQPTTFDFQPTTGNNRAASNLEPRRLDHCIIDLQPATCDIQHATCNIPYNI